jgi:hypothetical protein
MRGREFTAENAESAEKGIEGLDPWSGRMDQPGQSLVGQLKRTNVFEIDLTSRCLLGADQVGAADDVKGLVLIRHRLAITPGLVKCQARNKREDIDAHAILENRDLVGQKAVRGSQGCSAQTGFKKRFKKALDILSRGFDKEIKVKRRAWHAVQSGSDAADHDVVNVMGVQGPEYGLKSIEHHAYRPVWGSAAGPGR